MAPFRRWAVAGATGRRRGSTIVEWRRPSSTDTRARSSIPGWPLIRVFIDFIALHDLLHLLEPPWAKRRGDQRHGSGTLRRIHFFEADAAAAYERNGEIRPAFALLLVVERKENRLTLRQIETCEERVGGAYDSRSGARLLNGGSRERQINVNPPIQQATFVENTFIFFSPRSTQATAGISISPCVWVGGAARSGGNLTTAKCDHRPALRHVKTQ